MEVHSSLSFNYQQIKYVLQCYLAISKVQRSSVIGIKLCILPTPHAVCVETVVAAIQHLLNIATATCGKFELQFQSIKQGAAKRTWHSRQATAKGQRARQGAHSTQATTHSTTQ